MSKDKVDLTSVPLDVLEAEIQRRSAENQRKEELLEFLRTAPEGYQHFGTEISFDAEDFIRFLRDNWHLSLMSSVTDFKDIEGWIRRIIFGKTDGTKTVMRAKR